MPWRIAKEVYDVEGNYVRTEGVPAAGQGAG